MENFIERLNLYDILAMVIPGSIFLLGLGMFEPILNYAHNWPFIEYYGENGHAFWTVTATILFFFLTYLIGIIIHVLNIYIWCWSKHVNNYFVNTYIKNKIKAAYQTTRNDFLKRLIENENKLDIYYEAYNYAIIFHPQSAVLTLEKQIAMLRNTIIAITPLCVAIFPFTWYWNLACWFGIAILLSAITIARMQKVVELVFEEFKVVKLLELDKK